MPHIATTGDELVNLNSIIRFEPSTDRGYRRGWFVDEEGDLRHADFDSQVVEQAARTVIPNTTGYQYADLWEDEDGAFHVRPRPIIGWRISEYGNAEPVTGEYRSGSEDVEELALGTPLVAPNGEVHIGDSVFDDVTSFEKHLAERRERFAEWKARRAQASTKQPRTGSPS